MTTLNDCIEEAKVCLTICQPSSLVSRMTIFTVAPSEPSSPVHQCIHLLLWEEIKIIPTDKTDKVDKDKDKDCQSWKDLHFKDSDNTQVMLRPHSLSNSRNNFPNTRFRSFSRSNSRPRFGHFNQPVECYYCCHMGHTANNCFRCQNRNFPRRQPNQGRRNNFRNSRRYINYRTDTRNRNDNASQCVELISQIPLCIWIYRQEIINRHQFSDSHFQRNFRSHWGKLFRCIRMILLRLTIHWLILNH